ncbi:MAG: DUF86 domain-containing protein [Victivallaceae bacterium]|nr:DUF86 domain-containing protein [Victivallaceae bacterium]
MKYNGVIIKKIEIIDERLLKLNTLLPLQCDLLEQDFFLKSGIERTLQVCIEAVIDIAERIISLEDISPATTAFNALSKLEDSGILADAKRYKKMIQFRNFVVHRNEAVANEELVYICNNKLSDFKDFIKEVQRYE